MEINNLDDDLEERTIAIAAAQKLHETFIETALTETVVFVKNDIVWSKAPNYDPVLIKELHGRNPNFEKINTNKKIFKIKKRNY